jgi:hypothetical protein
MTTLTAFLQHSFVGKASQAQPYTAAAHLRYIFRKTAADLIYAENMPRNYHAAQRFLNAREDNLRANGRTIDKFIISIPRGIGLDHAAFALKRFGYRLGKGRVPFAFAIHGHGSSNYHAHFLLVDSDISTRRRVVKTTDRNSSARIKMEWESAANDTFAELGYEWRVKVKEGIEQEAANDNPEPEDVREDEEEMPAFEAFKPHIVYPNRDHLSAAANHVLNLRETVYEDEQLQAAKTRLKEAEERAENAKAQRERAAFAAAQHQAQKVSPAEQALYRSEQNLEGHKTASGKLKGFRLGAFGLEFKTSARKAAEQAQHAAEGDARALEWAQREQREYDHSAEYALAVAEEAERKAILARNSLVEVYGSDQSIKKTEETYANTIEKEMEGLSVDAVMEALANEEISVEDVRLYLILSGNEAMLDALEEGYDRSA